MINGPLHVISINLRPMDIQISREEAMKERTIS